MGGVWEAGEEKRKQNSQGGGDVPPDSGFWPLGSTNVQCFLTNFFHGVFGQAQRYLDWLCSVALCCVLLSASYCIVLCCCDVMCCDLSLTCYSSLLA